MRKRQLGPPPREGVWSAAANPSRQVNSWFPLPPSLLSPVGTTALIGVPQIGPGLVLVALTLITLWIVAGMIFGEDAYFSRLSRLRRRLKLKSWLPKETKALVKCYGVKPLVDIAVASGRASEDVIVSGLAIVDSSIKCNEDLVRYGDALAEIGRADPNCAATTFGLLGLLKAQIKDVDDLRTYGLALVPITRMTRLYGSSLYSLRAGMRQFAPRIKDIQDLERYGRLVTLVIRDHNGEEERLTGIHRLASTFGIESFITLMAECRSEKAITFGRHGIHLYADSIRSADDVLRYGRCLNQIADSVEDAEKSADVLEALSLFAGRFKDVQDMEQYGVTLVDLIRQTSPKNTRFVVFGLGKMCDEIMRSSDDISRCGRVLNRIAEIVPDPYKSADVIEGLCFFGDRFKDVNDMEQYAVALAGLMPQMSRTDTRIVISGLGRMRDEIKGPSDLSANALLRRTISYRASLPDRSYFQEERHMVPSPDPDGINYNYGSFPSGNDPYYWDGQWITVKVDPDSCLKNTLDAMIEVLERTIESHSGDGKRPSLQQHPL